ncbi:hypothetical protein MAPG_08748 [Magnaporthiopsis poae ATCC 64411]|uniref:Uncharacterized protein n=1 Tax=Magnaporthiopsis poae (strain ATCC 64411 / 73-15) TaxID=644358 RepID=A0A0C4E858_MAGP6|nr:hypothetical protein MAPG_08748 [Magnaporthiopsis poae ATCC 64411]
MKSLLINIPLLAGLSTAAINDLCQASGYQGTCQTTAWCGNRGGSQPVVGACPKDPDNVKCCLFPRCSSSRGFCMGTASGLCPTSFVARDHHTSRGLERGSSPEVRKTPRLGHGNGGHGGEGICFTKVHCGDLPGGTSAMATEVKQQQPLYLPSMLQKMNLSATLALAAIVMPIQAAASPAASPAVPIPAGSLLLLIGEDLFVWARI